MAIQAEPVASKPLVDGSTTDLHLHAGGALPTPVNILLAADVAAMAWANMPAALTEFRALTIHRTKADLASATQSRLVARVTVIAAVDAKLKVQYSTDETAWIDLCLVALSNTIGTKAGAWTNVPVGAKADVFIRLAGIDGNGAADPAFGLIALQVK